MLHHFYLLFLPLVLSNVLHMLVVKRNWLASVAVPVSEDLFGRNKTWRGFAVLPVLNGILMLLCSGLFLSGFSASTFLSGFVLGLIYLLFELPNSYLKRKMGIAPGQSSAENKWLYQMLDKTDSALGVCLFYFFLFPVSAAVTFMLFLAAICIHIFISWLLVSVKLKHSF